MSKGISDVDADLYSIGQSISCSGAGARAEASPSRGVPAPQDTAAVAAVPIPALGSGLAAIANRLPQLLRLAGRLPCASRQASNLPPPSLGGGGGASRGVLPSSRPTLPPTRPPAEPPALPVRAVPSRHASTPFQGAVVALSSGSSPPLGAADLRSPLRGSQGTQMGTALEAETGRAVEEAGRRQMCTVVST